MFKIGTYLSKIVVNLNSLAFFINKSNVLGLTDGNKLSENFFRDLLNDTFGYNLKNLNNDNPNCAGVDLGDEKEKICIQVTSDNSSEKIQESINKTENDGRHNNYDRIVIMIIGYKKKYKTTFNTTRFKFNFKKDIWDLSDIARKIQDSNDIGIATKVSDFLDSQLDPVIGINPIILNDQDMALLIDSIYDFLNHIESEDGLKKFKLEKREDDFIIKKNYLNNVDDPLFNNEIKPNLKYDSEIADFLGNPINSEYQKKYFIVTSKLQKIYEDGQNDFQGMGELFGYVFNGVAGYNNRSTVDGSKLLVLLHNMYFNCDIGKNPK